MGHWLADLLHQEKIMKFMIVESDPLLAISCSYEDRYCSEKAAQKAIERWKTLDRKWRQSNSSRTSRRSAFRWREMHYMVMKE
jgi:hypothetical protein